MLLLTVIYSIVLVTALGTAAIGAHRAFSRRAIPVPVRNTATTLSHKES